MNLPFAVLSFSAVVDGVPEGDVRMVSSVLLAGVVIVSSVVVAEASDDVCDGASVVIEVTFMDTEVCLEPSGSFTQAHEKDKSKATDKPAVILANLRTACLLRECLCKDILAHFLL